MAEFTFHIGPSDSPIQIIHHVGAPVPQNGRFYSVRELFTRKIWIDGEEVDVQKSYVTYKVAQEADKPMMYIDDLRAGYTHKTGPDINLEHRRLEVT